MEIEYSGGNWSPDGTKLVFVGQRDGKEHVATKEASGDLDTLQILYTEHRRGLTVRSAGVVARWRTDCRVDSRAGPTTALRTVDELLPLFALGF